MVASTGSPVSERAASERAAPSLAWRVLLTNAAVLLAVFGIVVVTPITVSDAVRVEEAVALALIFACAVVANVLIVRRVFAPLERLTDLMSRVDPLDPGIRVEARSGAGDVRQLAGAFNGMLERLESERRESARRAVLAQEAERRRIARELHDELGQSLTGVLLQIGAAARDGDPARLSDARETARESLEQARRIARDLRPDTLAELGLASALSALCTRFTRQTGVAVERELATELPPLPDEVEIVVYRVAQEGLTNVARHAGASRVRVAVAAEDGRLALTVDDDGHGLPPGIGREGRGVTGMRERALLARGRLHLGASPLGGARVRLEVPL